MKWVTPQVRMIGHTSIDKDGIDDFMSSEYGLEWGTDAGGEAEALVEFAGRMCYRSFQPGLNKNVTRIRQGNHDYVGNILSSGHGSVLEHATVSFLLSGVSRIVTHELVRHRVGTAYSQESLRFVRLDNLSMYYPAAFEEETLREVFRALPAERRRAFTEGFASSEKAEDAWVARKAVALRSYAEMIGGQLEDHQRQFAEEFHLDELTSFGLKKRITSAMRRFAPEGLATGIVVTANHRSWRDMVERRTSVHAEEEIRFVFAKVYEQLSAKFPALYQDATVAISQGMAEIAFTNKRV
jgi:thymidylate synthase (FAD)